MAQDLSENGRKSMYTNAGFEDEKSNNSRTNEMYRKIFDPTSIYYENNFMLIKNNDMVNRALTAMIAEVMSLSFVFIYGNGNYLMAGEEFKSVWDRYWMNFIQKALRFIAATGYLVWFKCELPNGLVIPEVIDPKHVSCDYITDRKTMVSSVVAKWRSRDNDHLQLYVIDSSIHPHVCDSWRIAPVDQCKTAVAMCIHADQCHMKAIQSMATPDIPLKKFVSHRHTDTHGDRLDFSQSTAGHIMEYTRTLAADDFTKERVRDASDSGAVDAATAIERKMMTLPPAFRIQQSLQSDISEHYRYVPNGLEPHDMGRNITEQREYLTMRKQFEAEIKEVFGLGSTGSVPSAESSGSSPNNKSGASGSGGGTSTAINSTMRMWMETASSILTSVFKIMYNPSTIRIGDIKPTYREEVKKIKRIVNKEIKIEKAIQLAISGSKRTELSSTTKPDNAKPTKKRKKVARPNSDSDDDYDSDSDLDDDKEEEEEDRHKTSRPRVKEDEPQKDSSAEKNEYTVEEPSDFQPGLGADTQHETPQNVDLAKSTIRIVPVRMIIADRDFAFSYMKQGGMSEDRFFELHPPVEIKRDDTEEKKLEEKEKAFAEKVQKEKERKLKEEAKESKARLNELASIVKKLESKMNKT